MRDIEQKRQELEETLEVLWDEITEETLQFAATLSRLRRAGKDSAEYDRLWGELSAILFELKMKASDANKLMEKIETLEGLEVKA